MAVNVPGVPQDALVPFTYVAIDPSRGGGATPRFRTLLVGQRLAAGTAAAEVPTPVGDAVNARTLFGAGSMLAVMSEAFPAQ